MIKGKSAFFSIGLIILSIQSVLDVVLFLHIYDPDTFKLSEIFKTILINNVFIQLLIFSFLIFRWLSYFLIRENIEKDFMIYRQKSINTKLNRECNKAKQASVAKTKFLSRVSHDMRTPMNGIIGMTKIAQKNISNQEQVKKRLAKIENISEHLLLLINDVLDMAKIEQDCVEIVNNPFDLRKVTKTCLDIIECQAENRNIEFVNEIRYLNESVIGDELHLKQILINVLSNAVKFTNDNGKIIFKAIEIEVSKYRFIVQDLGIGMSEEFLNKIFEPFSQENTVGQKVELKGTGLGMAIVKNLVDLMQGTINVESKQGEGTKITIDLCFVPQEKGELINENEQLLEELAGRKVLLVEDNFINVEIAKSMLDEVKISYDVALNGQEAIDKFMASKENEYNAILMDVMMPVLDGIEATKQIRSLDRVDAKYIYIIAMTANAYIEDKQAVLEAGMNEHISKPIDFNHLYNLLLNRK